jgi:hypothetical protein
VNGFGVDDIEEGAARASCVGTANDPTVATGIQERWMISIRTKRSIVILKLMLENGGADW